LQFGVAGFRAGFFGALMWSIFAAGQNELFLGKGRPEPPQGPTNIKTFNS